LQALRQVRCHPVRVQHGLAVRAARSDPQSPASRSTRY
jgi:hypothetical protein